MKIAVPQDGVAGFLTWERERNTFSMSRTSLIQLLKYFIKICFRKKVNDLIKKKSELQDTMVKKRTNMQEIQAKIDCVEQQK